MLRTLLRFLTHVNSFVFLEVVLIYSPIILPWQYSPSLLSFLFIFATLIVKKACCSFNVDVFIDMAEYYEFYEPSVFNPSWLLYLYIQFFLRLKYFSYLLIYYTFVYERDLLFFHFYLMLFFPNHCCMCKFRWCVWQEQI